MGFPAERHERDACPGDGMFFPHDESFALGSTFIFVRVSLIIKYKTVASDKESYFNLFHGTAGYGLDNEI